MKSAVETLSPTRVRLTVEVPFEELKPNLDATYKEISQQIQLPGFRKGKVPAALIDQRIGRQTVLGQAVNDAIPQLYANALQENNVEPLGQPELDLPEEPVDGEDLKFTAEVDVKPEIELPDYAGLEITVSTAEASDEHVDERLDSLRERFGTLEDVDRAAADGDHITIDVSGSKDGELLEEVQATGLSYRVGNDELLDGLDDAVRGLSAGESGTFTTTMQVGEHAGDEIDIAVTVQSVKEQKLPELNDEFAQEASEFDTLEELRADLREQDERSHRLQQANEARDKVLEKLLELMEVPLPDKVVEEELEARRNSILSQLSQVGMTLEQYLQTQEDGQSEEEFFADLDKRTRDSMRSQFVLDKVAEVEEVAVSQEELSQMIIERARQAQVDPREYMQQVIENNQAQSIVRDVARGKALAEVVNRAVVTDEAGNQVDFARLQSDGSLADIEESGEAEESTESESEAPAESESGETAQADDAAAGSSDESAEDTEKKSE